MRSFVYMLRCADDSYYVGSARGESLEMRFAQHQQGTFKGYTSTRRPVALVWSQEFAHVTDAISAERQVKGWSRAKKEALIEERWDVLQLLAKRGKKAK